MWLEKLEWLFNSDNVDHSRSVKLKLAELEYEPLSKKTTLEVIATADNQASSYHLESDAWQVKNEDKEIIETGSQLADKQMQYLLCCVKNNNICSTLLQSRQKAQTTREFIWGDLL